jgi:hypothetical protein
MDATKLQALVREARALAHWNTGFGPKEYGQYLQNKRGYSHKRTNRRNLKK